MINTRLQRSFVHDVFARSRPVTDPQRGERRRGRRGDYRTGQGVRTYVTGSNPIIAPVRPLAIVPDSIARIASGTISSRRCGISVLMPAIMMPTEPRLAKPHIA